MHGASGDGQISSVQEESLRAAVNTPLLPGNDEDGIDWVDKTLYNDSGQESRPSGAVAGNAKIREGQPGNSMEATSQPAPDGLYNILGFDSSF